MVSLNSWKFKLAIIVLQNNFQTICAYYKKCLENQKQGVVILEDSRIGGARKN